MYTFTTLLGELVQISHSLMHNLAVLTLKAGRKVQDIASTSEVGGWGC